MRATYHHGNLATALVDEAGRMIESTGVQGFSLRECAKSLGVDVAAVYRHYPSKDALVAAVAEHGLRELGRRIERATARVAARGSAEVFMAIGRAYVAFAMDRPTLYAMVFNKMERADCARDAGSEALAAKAKTASSSDTQPTAYGMLCLCLDRMVEDGVITASARPGAELAAWAAVHGMASLMNQGLIRVGNRQREQLVEQLCQIVLRGLHRSEP